MFKKGDKVLCIDDSKVNYIKKLNVYTIIKTKNDMIVIMNNLGEIEEYFSKRFIKLESDLDLQLFDGVKNGT